MSQEIRDFFMEEAGELFDNLNSILLKNEEAGDISDEELDSLFRDVHTLKGGAGSVELTKFSGYTHHLETFMDMVRDHKIKLNEDVIEFLIDSVGVMQEILDEEYEQSLDDEEYESRMEELLQKIESLQNPDLGSNESEKSSKSEFGESAAMMLDLLSELDVIIEKIEKQQEANRDDLDTLFRAVHTIKGSSSFLNLNYLPKYLHELESVLDHVRGGEIPYSMEFNKLMREVYNNTESFIDKELNSSLDISEFEKSLSNLQENLRVLSQIESKSEDIASDQGFELFDDEPMDSNGSESVAFELFDDEPKEQKDMTNSKKESELMAFELFDEDNTPKQEEKKTSQKSSDKESKKVKESSKKKDLSLNKAAASTSIRVNLDKIDNLMNRVGDLVITKSMLFQFSESIEDSHLSKMILERLFELDRDIRELQESVMSVRMVPMESVYQRLPKMVRDLAKKLGKKVKFEHLGDSVEIDKMMVEGLMDPLTHIIRNSLDHGIEKPEIRKEKGKDETGKLIISAEQESGNIIISITDDGAGINVEKVAQKALETGAVSEDELERMSEQDKVMLVFHPGLSTAEEVTDVSGRGVGMDVVMNNINSLGGYIKADTTKDKGTKFQIILPLTLAILDGLNILIGDKKFILPLNAIVESLQPKAHMIKHIGESKKEMLMLRKEFIPIIRLSRFFGLEPRYENLEEGMLIVVNATKSKVALFVDDFLNQEQIVVKSLEKNYKKIRGIGAATIRGDGSIGLILDVSGIVNNCQGEM